LPFYSYLSYRKNYLLIPASFAENYVLFFLPLLKKHRSFIPVFLAENTVSPAK
jgi:hypothetical protein